MNVAMGCSLDLDTFRSCWNSMCEIKPEMIAMLRLLVNLQSQGTPRAFHLHVIASTNLMHKQYIESQFAMNGINFSSITYMRSYEQGTLDPAILFTKAFESFDAKETFVDLQQDKRPLLEVIQDKLCKTLVSSSFSQVKLSDIASTTSAKDIDSGDSALQSTKFKM